MKKIYENFEEIAEEFTDGEGWTHRLSDHTDGECFPWQHGVYEFAKFLDTVGVKIIANPEIHETLWKDFRNYKPKKFKKYRTHKMTRMGKNG